MFMRRVIDAICQLKWWAKHKCCQMHQKSEIGFFGKIRFLNVNANIVDGILPTLPRYDTVRRQRTDSIYIRLTRRQNIMLLVVG
ncbi:hypothetical protein QUF90_02000 [Desulfococcaceae bacterium HSG9]|nr:hypothetical protein [Desulfococcaceae bacterium HSG9]